MNPEPVDLKPMRLKRASELTLPDDTSSLNEILVETQQQDVELRKRQKLHIQHFIQIHGHKLYDSKTQGNLGADYSLCQALLQLPRDIWNNYISMLGNFNWGDSNEHDNRAWGTGRQAFEIALQKIPNLTWKRIVATADKMGLWHMCEEIFEAFHCPFGEDIPKNDSSNMTFQDAEQNGSLTSSSIVPSEEQLLERFASTFGRNVSLTENALQRSDWPEVGNNLHTVNWPELPPVGQSENVSQPVGNSKACLCTLPETQCSDNRAVSTHSDYNEGTEASTLFTPSVYNRNLPSSNPFPLPQVACDGDATNVAPTTPHSSRIMFRSLPVSFPYIQFDYSCLLEHPPGHGDSQNSFEHGTETVIANHEQNLNSWLLNSHYFDSGMFGSCGQPAVSPPVGQSSAPNMNTRPVLVVPSHVPNYCWNLKMLITNSSDAARHANFLYQVLMLSFPRVTVQTLDSLLNGSLEYTVPEQIKVDFEQVDYVIPLISKQYMKDIDASTAAASAEAAAIRCLHVKYCNKHYFDGSFNDKILAWKIDISYDDEKKLPDCLTTAAKDINGLLCKIVNMSRKHFSQA